MHQPLQLPATLLGLLLTALYPTCSTASPAADQVQVQTVTITAAPSIPSTIPQFTDTAKFTSAILNSTNVYRSEHNATAVSWNHTLAKYASSYLSSMGPESPDSGSECDFAHSGGPYGENLAIGCNEVTGCVELWGDERDEYSFNKPGFSEETGHFTQLVWKDTTTVGCARRLCGTRAWYIVCEYWPRGNVIGEFGEEVGRRVNGKVDKAPGNNGMWSWAERKGKPGTFQGPWFSYYGAGPFTTTQELEAWCNHNLDVCLRFKKAPDDTPRFGFKEGLVLTHQDISPRNLVLGPRAGGDGGDDFDLWILDWDYSGAYPPGFEQAALSVQCSDFPGFADMVLERLPAEHVRAQMLTQRWAIDYGLTTGAFL